MMSIVDEPARTFGDEGQDHNAEDREDALDSRGNAPSPRAEDWSSAVSDACCEEAACASS